MTRIFASLGIDLRDRKQAKVAVMFLMLIAAYFGLFHEKTAYAQAPEGEATEQSAAGEEGAEAAEGEAEGAEEATEDEAAEEAPAETISILALFNQGGWAMYPLLLSSIIGMIVILERLYYFFTVKVLSRTFQQELSDNIEVSGMEGVNETLDRNEGFAVTRILKEGMKVGGADPELFSRGVERESTSLMTRSERGLSILAAVSTIAPLIGFLGTVSGMINAFDAIANADTVNAKVVAGGIKEALITTATGLIVGIPAMAFFQYFSSKVNAFATEIEQAANAIYKELLKRKAGSGV